jgi:hypothetical protein
MSAGWVNLVVAIAIPAIVAGFVAVTYVARTRRGGRKAPGLARPSRTADRKLNPKTGTLFP